LGSEREACLAAIEGFGGGKMVEEFGNFFLNIIKDLWQKLQCLELKRCLKKD